MVASAAGELRQDLITGKWVAIAPGRSGRPHDFAQQQTKKPIPKYVDNCPFCNLADFPQEPDHIRLPDDPDAWEVHVFGNKYPAFRPADDLRAWEKGPYRALESVGFHEVLATRWHHQHETAVPRRVLAMELEALQMRYRQLMKKSSVNYIQIIKNYGLAGGASLEHPHHQIFTTPVLPSDVADLFYGAERYASQHQQDPFTVMLQYELEQRERVVWENDQFVLFCPFASRAPYEMWIMPRQANPHFESIAASERDQLAEVLQQALRRLKVAAHDPAYNYFILSAPCDATGFVCNLAAFQHFRWHIEIVPRIGSWGGFEVSTGLEIVTLAPETAAAQLREVDIQDKT